MNGLINKKDSLISKILKESENKRNDILNIEIINKILYLNDLYVNIPLYEKCKIIEPKSTDSVDIINKISIFILEMEKFISDNPNFVFINDNVNYEDLFKIINILSN